MSTLWGSVLSKYGQRVVICEAHGSAGGAAHGFSCKLPKEGGALHTFEANFVGCVWFGLVFVFDVYFFYYGVY